MFRARLKDLDKMIFAFGEVGLVNNLAFFDYLQKYFWMRMSHQITSSWLIYLGYGDSEWTSSYFLCQMARIEDIFVEQRNILLIVIKSIYES